MSFRKIEPEESYYPYCRNCFLWEESDDMSPYEKDEYCSRRMCLKPEPFPFPTRKED